VGLGQIFGVPDVQFFVFSTSSDESTTERDRNLVDVGFMGFEGGFNLNVGVPDFKSSIPSY
jgi:hypothetical protein